MKRKNIIGICVLAVSLAGCMGESTARIRGRSQSWYSFSGAVLDAETGKPIEGAHVKTVWDVDYSFAENDQGNEFERCAFEPTSPLDLPISFVSRNVSCAPRGIDKLQPMFLLALEESSAPVMRKPEPGKVYNACTTHTYAKECWSFTVTDAQGRFSLKKNYELFVYKAGYKAYRGFYESEILGYPSSPVGHSFTGRSFI